jgi:hypothetical protein
MLSRPLTTATGFAMTDTSLPLFDWARNREDDFSGSCCWLFWSRKAKGYHQRQALVDVEDFERFRDLKLKIYHDAKAGHHRVRLNHQKPYPTLARIIMGAPKDMVVDHANRDTLDDRRKNLRVCTVQQNAMNARKRANATSKYLGVSYNSATGRWVARIRYNYKLYSLGLFTSEVEAARAYNRKARELGGEFAYQNPVLG